MMAANQPSVLHGLAGLAKAWLGLDRATAQEVSLRRMTCVPCRYRHRAKCLRCGCWLKEKTLVASEHCPIGRW